MIQKVITISIMLCLFQSGRAFSQESFIWKFDVSKVGIADIVEINNSLYALAGSTHKYDRETNRLVKDSALVICKDIYGNTLQKTYKVSGYEMSGFQKIISNKNNEIIAFGTTLPYGFYLDTNVFFAVAYDTLLNVKWDVQITIPRIDLVVRDAMFLKDRDILVGLEGKNRFWFPPSPVPQLYFVELSNNGTINRIVEDSVGWLTDIALHPDSTRFYCFGDFSYYTPSSNYATIVFDTAYNRIAAKPFFSDEIGNPGTGIWISDDTLLFSGANTAVYSDDDIAIYKIIETDSLVIVKQEIFRFPCTTDGSLYNGITVTKDNRIVQIADLDWTGNLRGWIGIYNMDLELIDYKIIEREDGYSGCGGVISTIDSGFLVKTYFKTNPILAADTIFITKYDKNSILSNVEEYSCSSSTKHLLFPNPGKDYFNLILSKNNNLSDISCLQMYNSEGRQIGEWQLSSQFSYISANTIPSGMYYYRVINNNKIICSGKWIKQ